MGFYKFIYWFFLLTSNCISLSKQFHRSVDRLHNNWTKVSHFSILVFPALFPRPNRPYLVRLPVTIICCLFRLSNPIGLDRRIVCLSDCLFICLFGFARFILRLVARAELVCFASLRLALLLARVQQTVPRSTTSTTSTWTTTRTTRAGHIAPMEKASCQLG